MRNYSRIAATLLCLGALHQTALADNSIPGLTFTVEADSDYPFCCSAIVGLATAGVYFSYDYGSHGLSEFALRFTQFPRNFEDQYATISFDFVGFHTRSQFSEPGSDRVVASTYRADNLASVVDYRPRELDQFGNLGSFAVGAYGIGDRITLDATEAFRHAAFSRYAALGILLTLDTASNGTFASYDNFVLNVGPIPEPETYALMLCGLAAIQLRRKTLLRSKLKRSSSES